VGKFRQIGQIEASADDRFLIDRESLKKYLNSIDFCPERAEGVFLGVAVCGRRMTFCMSDLLYKISNRQGIEQ